MVSTSTAGEVEGSYNEAGEATAGDDGGTGGKESSSPSVKLALQFVSTLVLRLMRVGGKPRSLCRPRCRVCRQEVAAKGDNTSNLYSHLKTQHPELYMLMYVRESQSPSIRLVSRHCLNHSRRCNHSPLLLVNTQNLPKQ